MKKSMNYAIALLLAGVAVSFAGPDKAAVEKIENAAWQAFKDKDAAAFQKLIDKDLRAVYDEGIMKLSDELEAMKKWDMKSFAISNFDMFSDEKDVVVTTYVVKVEGTYDGHDMSGTYNAGSVWKMEGNDWLGIFHTNIKQGAGAAAK
jgi:FlaG/FlaF family flagellin (archaellin)